MHVVYMWLVWQSVKERWCLNLIQSATMNSIVVDSPPLKHVWEHQSLHGVDIHIEHDGWS